MTRLAWLLAIAACTPSPTRNQVVGSLDRVSWKDKLATATFDGKIVRLDLGRVSVVIASCYAHAQQKPGDHDHVQIELDHVAATTGELDIDDCSTKHILGTLWAKFPDGTRVDAKIDTDLAKP